MNALKKFITQNKALVIMTTSVTMGIFLIFTVIAVAISGTPSSTSQENPSVTDDTETTGMNVVDKPTESETVTIPEYSGEESSCGSEEDTTEEPTTEPPVDPYTLPYMIKVNRAANCITVYAKSEDGNFTVPVKAITVSCGKNVGDTPLGTYQTINEYLWRKMVDGTYAQYAYRIVGPILFHSVPYYTQNKNDLEWEEFNKLGTAASLGCVRMTVIDAKWLMDNCPIGTLVEIYDDAANPGPLGKPDVIKIPETAPDELKKWDPTDPDPSNPWKAYCATISYPATGEVRVMQGVTIEEIMANFTAKDTCGNDITDKIKITGTYDLNVVGTYPILLQVQDAIGSRAEVSINIVVESTETESSSEDETSSEEGSTSESETSSEDGSTSEGETSSEDSSTSEGETSSEDGSTSDVPTSSEEQTTTEPISSEEQTTTPTESESQGQDGTTTASETETTTGETTTAQ